MVVIVFFLADRRTSAIIIYVPIDGTTMMIVLFRNEVQLFSAVPQNHACSFVQDSRTQESLPSKVLSREPNGYHVHDSIKKSVTSKSRGSASVFSFQEQNRDDRRRHTFFPCKRCEQDQGWSPQWPVSGRCVSHESNPTTTNG